MNIEVVIREQLRFDHKRGDIKGAAVDASRKLVVGRYTGAAADLGASTSMTREVVPGSPFASYASLPDFSTIVEVFTYGFGSAAAAAVFLRNVFGAIKDWKDLRRMSAPSTIQVRIGGRPLLLKQGDNLEEVIAKLAAENEAEHPPAPFQSSARLPPSSIRKARSGGRSRRADFYSAEYTQSRLRFVNSPDAPQVLANRPLVGRVHGAQHRGAENRAVWPNRTPSDRR